MAPKQILLTIIISGAVALVAMELRLKAIAPEMPPPVVVSSSEPPPVVSERVKPEAAPVNEPAPEPTDPKSRYLKELLDIVSLIDARMKLSADELVRMEAVTRSYYRATMPLKFESHGLTTEEISARSEKYARELNDKIREFLSPERFAEYQKIVEPIQKR